MLLAMEENKNSGENKRLSWYKRFVSLPFIVFLLAVAYILLLSDYSMSQYAVYKERIAVLEEEIKISTDTFDYYFNLNNQLRTDPEKLEKIVREKYRMQRENEDVYVFE